MGNKLKSNSTSKVIIGWIGAISFAISALPQALRSIHDGNSNGLEWSFLLLWLLGELCSIYFIWNDKKKLAPLLFNYISNIIFLDIIIYFKVFPRFF
jgi:uncharacterized protein with PQ loop repeat